MSVSLSQIKSVFNGRFLTEPGKLQSKLDKIRAFVFDWDGVFNNGLKNENGSSAFSEVDAMGTNLLRFNHHLHTKTNPLTVIISGEKNQMAFDFAQREHFHEVYFRIRNKADALKHFCLKNNISEENVAFVFDDVLDFSVARVCGLRLMAGRNCHPLLNDFVTDNNLADYITYNDGGNYAVREVTELLIALRGDYDVTISERMNFGEKYAVYWKERNYVNPIFFTAVESGEMQQQKL